MATEGTGQPSQELIVEIKAVIARAKSGDGTAVPELRGHLDRHPELWQRYGDAAAQAERGWINLAAGQNLHLRECMIRFAEAQRAELTRPGAAPAERMLVDRVVACGLRLQFFSALEVNSVEAKDSPKLHQWWAKRHAQAQRAFQVALSSLLTVQKLFPITPTLVAPVVTAAEVPSVSAPNPSVVAPATDVPVEERSDHATFQATGWNALHGEADRAGLVTVRA